MKLHTEGDLSENKKCESFSFCFVAQKGKIEFEAALLAASLKKNVKLPCEIIAAVPWSPDGQFVPDNQTLDFLSSIGARVEEFKNPVAIRENFVQPYPHSNKMFALALAKPCDKVIFLDSDSICHTDFSCHVGFSLPLTLMYVGYNGAHIFGRSWEDLYDRCGIPAPKERRGYRGAQNKIHYAPPTFAANFIAVSAEYLPRLRSLWFEIYQQMLEEKLFSDDGLPLYYCDQVAFSLAVHKLNEPYELWPWHTQTIEHYWSMNTLLKKEKLLHVVIELGRTHPLLGAIYDRIAAECGPELFPTELSPHFRS